ncbi:MAG: DUF3887 domain-containing protein [Luteimonas sp.]
MTHRSLRFALALFAAFAFTSAWAQDPSERAIGVLDQLDAGQYEEVAATFDPEMAAAMDANALGQVWASIPQQVGALQSRGEPVADQQAGHDVVMVPLQYERAAANAILSFNADGQLAGLFIQPVDVAPVDAQPAADPE